jgi:hypothetical protein
MRVFTQRSIINLLAEHSTSTLDHWTAVAGNSPDWDELYEQFNSKYPGAFPRAVNPLDYCIVFDPPIFLVGKYWGGEETLSMATEWVTARNTMGWLPASVLTCDDNQHIAEFTAEQLLLDLPPEYASIINGHVKVGHYLASNPDAFVLTP